jgi:hypothetical protein
MQPPPPKPRNRNSPPIPTISPTIKVKSPEPRKVLPSRGHRGHRASHSLPSSMFSTFQTTQPSQSKLNTPATTLTSLASKAKPSSIMNNKIIRLAKKRLRNYNYFERIHMGGGGENRVHWMNMVRIRRSDLVKAYRRRDPTLQKRGCEYYSLGMSIGSIISSSASIKTLLEAVRQLLLEYEFCYHSKNSASQNISLMMASDRGLFPVGSDMLPSTFTNPQVYKHYNKPLYVMLDTTNCPGSSIDYIEVVLSLCSIISEFYERILKDSERIINDDNNKLCDTLLSIDTTLTKRVVQVITGDMHAVAIDLLREQQQNIATLFDSELLIPTLFGIEKKQKKK